MRKFRKWFLVILILVTISGWNVNFGEQVVDEDYVNNFLNKILNKLLSGEHGISEIELAFDCYTEYMWAALTVVDSIKINWNVFYYAKNEAEIAFLVAHEAGHWVTRYDVFRSHDEKERAANLMGIFLMSKAGYDTSCAVRILQWIFDSDVCERLYDKEYIEEFRKRIEDLPSYIEEYFEKTQKKWILITPEELEKIKTFCWNEYWLEYYGKPKYYRIKNN